MPMHYLNLFSNDDIPEDRKKRENGRHSSLPEDDQEWHMVHFKPIGEISNSSATLVCMSDDDDLVSPVDEFLQGALIRIEQSKR